MTALDALVDRIAHGDHRMTSADIHALVEAGHPREAILDALVAAAARPAASRRLHHALAVLRDTR